MSTSYPLTCNWVVARGDRKSACEMCQTPWDLPHLSPLQACISELKVSGHWEGAVALNWSWRCAARQDPILWQVCQKLQSAFAAWCPKSSYITWDTYIYISFLQPNIRACTVQRYSARKCPARGEGKKPNQFCSKSVVTYHSFWSLKSQSGFVAYICIFSSSQHSCRAGCPALLFQLPCSTEGCSTGFTGKHTQPFFMVNAWSNNFWFGFLTPCYRKSYFLFFKYWCARSSCMKRYG